MPFLERLLLLYNLFVHMLIKIWLLCKYVNTFTLQGIFSVEGMLGESIITCSGGWIVRVRGSALRNFPYLSCVKINFRLNYNYILALHESLLKRVDEH